MALNLAKTLILLKTRGFIASSTFKIILSVKPQIKTTAVQPLVLFKVRII